MPIYEYICKKCGNTFELIRFASDSDSDIECPKCGSEKVKRAVSLPAGSQKSCEGCSSSGSSCAT